VTRTFVALACGAHKKDMGANVVVVNNDNSVIASRNVLGNDPDGYTVMLGKSSTCIEKVNGAFEGFDFDSFEYLGTLTENPAQCIAVKPKLGVKTLPELIEYSKQHPGECALPTKSARTPGYRKTARGLGRPVHIGRCGRELRQDTAFLGDHCEVLVTLYASMEEYVKAGECVVLATISDERNPLFPDVPTAKEQGITCLMGRPCMPH
jgi:tripartite-type tricarboxylate transporter receptor subunit TctC